ncbi:hypothetical protein Tco_0835976 [Tanacetum coccineum]
MLEMGIYVTWSSCFMRYVDDKKEHRKMIKDSIENGPSVMKQITDPTSPTNAPPTKEKRKQNLLAEEKKRFKEDIDVINMILLGIPNDIYNFVDACQTAKAIRNNVKRLMHGTYLSKQERDSRLTNEFHKFSVEARESLESIYERFSRLMNNIERNKVLPSKIAINTKFLNSLHPEWSDDQEDKLSTAMMLLARAITQHFLTPTNNRLHTCSNTRNQAVIQDGRMDIQSKNVGFAGNGSMNFGRIVGNQGSNVGNGFV